MNVSGLDKEDDNTQLENSNSDNIDEEIPDEEMGVDLPPPSPDVSDKNLNNDDKQSNNSGGSISKNQVIVLVAITWGIILISIISIVIVTTFKSNSSKQENDNTKIVPTYNLEYTIISSIQCEDDSYRDYVTINKSIALYEGNIIPVFTGLAENYDKEVIIPVSLAEYNSLVDKTRIEIVFSRLKISGVEKIVVKDWSIAS